MDRYREMQAETQKMREKNQQLAEQDQHEEQMKAANAGGAVNENKANNEKVKNTSFDAIRSKLSADKPQKEANGRKSVNKKQAAKEEIKRTNTMG